MCICLAKALNIATLENFVNLKMYFHPERVHKLSTVCLVDQ